MKEIKEFTITAPSIERAHLKAEEYAKDWLAEHDDRMHHNEATVIYINTSFTVNLYEGREPEYHHRFKLLAC